MKNIITSLGVIVFVGAVVAGATGAFFSSEATSLSNTFTAGSVDITVSNIDHVYFDDSATDKPQFVPSFNTPTDSKDGWYFALNDLKPRDAGTITYDLKNGANAAHFCVMAEQSGTSVLGDYLAFDFNDAVGSLNDVSGTWFDLASNVQANETGEYSVKYCFGTFDGQGDCILDPSVSDYNDAQLATLQVGLRFYAEQIRNNPDFDCADLNPEPIVVGANLETYTALDIADNTVCHVTVAKTGQDHTTIQAGIDASVNGQTVCVAEGVYDEDVNVNKEITLSGDGASATSVINGQAANFGGALVISANNVTVEGFEINGAVGSQHAVRFATGVSGATFSDNVVNAPNGGNALLTQGSQSNHLITNNVLVGNNSPQVAYVNGSASLSSQPSDDVDFTNNSFEGTIVGGGMALGIENTNADITGNSFADSLTSSYTIVESWKADAVINFNNFNGVGGVKVANSDPGSDLLNAENNWWGEAIPTGHVSGNVDDDPKAVSPYPTN
jgi:hypothetical protein